MLGLAWVGSYLSYKHRLAYNRPLLWLTFLSFPLPFVAIITGWFTAEVGRQPWVVYGVLRTADAMTPFLTTREATISLIIFCSVYAFIFLFGTFYIYRLIRTGPARQPFEVPPSRGAKPADVVGRRGTRSRAQPRSLRENNHGHVLGFASGRQHSALRVARWRRSRRRLAVRTGERRGAGEGRC